MAWVVDPKSVSFNQIRSDLMTYLQSKPDYLRWKDFYNSSAGQVLVELIAGMGTWLQHKAVVGRRETYLPYNQNRSSAVARAEAGGYSCDRGQNVHLTLSITPTSTVSLAKYSIVGTVKDADIMLLDDYVFNAGVPIIISVVIGNLLYEDFTVPDSEPQIFRFSSPRVTEDIQLQKGLYVTPGDVTTFSGSILPTSEHIVDLLNDYYITLSNTLDAIDVMYLNNNTADPYYYSTGDVLRLYYVEAYDLTFQFSDITFNYGTVHGYVYNGTTIWAPTTAYVISDYITSTLVANNSRDVKPYLFNNAIAGSSNSVGEPYWSTTAGLITADISITDPNSWVANTVIILGELVIPTSLKLNGYYYKCTARAGAFKTHATTEPAWPAVVGAVIVDQDITWTCLNKMDYNTVAHTSIAYDLTWSASKTYLTGETVTPSVQNGYYYTCLATGISDATQPVAWGTTVGANTADNTINWVCHLTTAWTCNTATVRDNDFIAVETLDAIKVNAPLYYESQFTIRARDDFMKIFKDLDSRIADTNYQDITPAVVELTYVRTDAPNVFTSLQKQDLINQMNPRKGLGIPDPMISDPSLVTYTLDFKVYMQYPGSYPVVDSVNTIIAAYDEKFFLTIGRVDIFDIERQVEDLVSNNIEYVKKCVITINAPTWTPSTAYVRGDCVKPTTANGYVYECIRAGTSDILANEPIWVTVISEANIDNVAIGSAVVDNADLGTLVWRCRQQVDNTTPGSTVTYNLLSSLAWNEYYNFSSNVVIVSA